MIVYVLVRLIQIRKYENIRVNILEMKCIIGCCDGCCVCDYQSSINKLINIKLFIDAYLFVYFGKGLSDGFVIFRYSRSEAFR